MVNENKSTLFFIQTNHSVDLVDYASSKFGAVGLAESLALELDAHGSGITQNRIYSTIVCPFYINTGMFDGVKSGCACFFISQHCECSCSSRLLPILEQDYAADRIVDTILTNTEMLLMPRIIYVLYFLKGYLFCVEVAL